MSAGYAWLVARPRPAVRLSPRKTIRGLDRDGASARAGAGGDCVVRDAAGADGGLRDGASLTSDREPQAATAAMSATATAAATVWRRLVIG